MVLARTIIALAFASLTAPLLAQQPVDPPPPGQWLLDYGLAYGRAVGDPSREDAEYVLTWIMAAAKVSPDLAEAHLWQYDLLSRLDRGDEALRALRAYCRCAPRDLSARLNLIDIEFDRAQTAEDRVAVCEAHLRNQDLPREIASDLHRRLAQIRENQAATEEARRHAARAVECCPQNLPAQTLLARIEGKLDKPATQVRLLLQEIAANPASAERAWRLARSLDALSLHAEALIWYDAAMQAFARQNPDTPLPTELLLDQARSYFDAGDDDQALTCCQHILAAEPAAVEAATLLVRTAHRGGREDLAAEHTAALDTRFRDRQAQALERRDPELCRQIASFHLEIKPDPDRALQFALLADRYQPRDPRVRRTLGVACVESGKYDEALEILTPLAGTDQQAACALARAQRARGDEEAAAKTLRRAQSLRYSGAAYRRIVELLGELHEEPAPKPDRADVLAVLEDFDYRVLDFPSQASAALDFHVNLESDTCAVGQPLRARFTLANNGPYPITLGRDRMVDPRVSVSVKDTARRGVVLEDYLTVSLDDRYVLLPGERIETTRRLGTAAARPLLNYQPQRTISLEFTFILDPVMASGGALASALAGMKPVTCRAARVPVNAAASGIGRLALQLQSGSEAQRLAALDSLLALILERYESQQDKPHTYSAVTVDAGALTRLIQQALDDPTPVVRARALAALIHLRLDDQAINAAAPLITDQSWLARLLAVEMFAKKQGLVFLPVLERLGEDTNPLVAKLARLYRDQAQEMQSKQQETPPPTNEPRP